MPAKPYELPPDFEDLEKAQAESLPVTGIARRRKGGFTTGKAAFVLFKAANPVLQYLIFARGWGHSIFALLGRSPACPHIGMLSPKQKVLVGVAMLGAARQVFWCLCINESPLSPLDAAHIAVFDLLADSSNSVLSLASSAWNLGPSEWWGSAAVLVGSVIESLSELQRKWFRAEKTSSLQVNGLWRWARHVNYAGFLIWRSGYAAITGNSYAFWNPGLHLCHFAVSAIPLLERYQELKYGEEWARYKRQTPYKLLPYVW
ncbi:hypothetical protein HDU86_008498 [Geranomyces michiganensis]|nr:hypothetical protein HDU86_008498 [Geranomyces michiganensis]